MSLKMVGFDEAYVNPWVSAAGTNETLRFYFGDKQNDGLGPQGFLTTVTNRTIASHCHAVDQFQVLLGAPGSMYQRHEIPPLMLHYADAYATYGPLIGTDPCLRFFTLRPREDRTMFYMPADRPEVPYLAHRQRHVEIDTALDLPVAGEVVTSQLVEAEADGLEALLITAGPNASFVVSPAPRTNGQYVNVAGGTVSWGGTTYGELALGWQLPDDEPAELQAGPSGCRVLVLRFPSPATETVRAAAEKVSSGA